MEGQVSDGTDAPPGQEGCEMTRTYEVSFHVAVEESTVAGLNARVAALTHFLRKIGVEELVVDGPRLRAKEAAA